MNALIQKAIGIAGSQDALAKACNVSQAAVSKWLSGKTIRAENAKEIELATKGRVTRHDLRPDIFDPPQKVDDPTREDA
jgi:DNA-binding transcriptional regulator YdaS (Cro superfamily)